MIIKNGRVFGENGLFETRDIYVEDHKIVAALDEVKDQHIVDASGYLVIPGLVDIHSHGAYGHDFSDADVEGLKAILRFEKSRGITSYCPTSMTLPSELLLKIFATVKEAGNDEDMAKIVGINMEGPFLDVDKKGAHVAEYLVQPDVEMFRACNAASGNRIKLVTLAPNVPGAMEFIEAVKDEVTVSIGHTSADYDTASAAMEAGAHHVTHLYNAMPPFAHRDPGVIGAAADDEKCMVELISDGYHIHPSVVRSTFRLFGSERVILISDSMMATGMENGEYELGGQKVIMKDCRATLEDGTLAGSATDLFGCMKKAISVGVPAEEAVFAVTRNPAVSIGIYDRVGSITPGKDADLLLLDDNWDLVKVLF
ncbi:MAG: N-acetylglucosamine-6-phosphate deacetylase [Blautia sp.]